MPKEPTPTLALASTSPRRRQLLAEAGLEHEVIAPGVDDGALAAAAVDPHHWVTALAYMKAAAGLGQWRAHQPERRAVVLAADTVCVIDESPSPEVIGQPEDADHARAIITRFQNAPHRVLTGVALIDAATDAPDLFATEAHVRVGAIPPDDLNAYLRSGGWHGKAGAYNLFDRLDAGWPIEFDGDPNTIVGLPVADLLPRLAAHGIMPNH